MVHCKSRKKKLNKKDSTEAGVVSVSYYLPYEIWIYLFMGAQGYYIKQNILFQNNQSAIKTEKNGKKSYTGDSRHIDIRYLFARKIIESNKMSIPYCSTEHILADFFTKALQGALFAKFRDVIMGWKHVDALQIGPPSTKEHVGNMVKVRSNQE